MDNSISMIVIGVTNPDAPDALEAYQRIALPLFLQAGGKPVGKYRVIGQLAGSHVSTLIAQMDFPSEKAVAGVFESPAYREALGNRDRAFLDLNVYLTRRMA